MVVFLQHFCPQKLLHVPPLQAETSLTENNTNKESYFRAVTFNPMEAGGEDEYDDNDDSYTTYSYEYDSSDDYNAPTNSDKKLFRSSKIVMKKDGGRKGRNKDILEEESLLRFLKKGASPSEYKREDYKLGHRDDDMKKGKGKKKKEFEGSIERSKEVYLTRRGGSDESQASWGLAAFGGTGDTRSSFITFATVLPSIFYAVVDFIYVTVSLTST